ncbi:MAG: hypothetical protein PVG60_03630 [Desulfarculaceae bacterium]|jgi:hypothetical protein
MNIAREQAQGLTKVILQTLLDMTDEIEAEGETLSEELLHRVEQDVSSRLRPRDTRRDQLIFDMVLKRSFAEARSLLGQVAGMADSERNVYPFPSLPTRQAVV